MGQIRIAIVCSDAALRLEAARAFDDAPASWDVDLCDHVPSDRDVVVGIQTAPGIDVVYDPNQPQGLIEAVSDHLGSRRGPVLVTSACGGSGATTVAIHLAGALASKAPTCYVDLDPGLAGGARLGLGDNAHRFDPAEDLLTIPHAGGFRTMLAPEHGKVAVEAATSAFSSCVVDAPAECLEDLLKQSRVAIVVVPPTVPGVIRTRRFLDRFVDNWLVVGNRVGPGGDRTQRELERELGRHFDLMLPTSALLRDSEDVGGLLTTSFSRWTRAMARLSAAVEL